MKKTIFFTVAAFAIIATFLVGCEGQNSLSTPSNFKAYQEGNTIVLSWNEVSGASYYEINKNGSYWQSTSETSIVDKSPREGINSYELIASDGDKQSKPAKASCEFESSNPGGGGGGEQTSTDFYIKHPWGSGSDDSWSWKPMTKSGNSYTYTGLWGGVGANINTTADDSGAEWYEASKINGASSLSVGTQVTFTFVSTNGNKGTLSVSASTGGGTETGSLPAPTGFKLSQTSEYVQLSWNRVSGAVGYYALWYNSQEQKWYVLGETTSTSYKDYEVTSGETYIYGVTAIDASGNNGEIAYDQITFNGSSSGGGGGSTTSKPSTPTGINATAASSYIVVTWNSVSGAESYNVYRSTSASGTYTFQSSVTTTNYTDYNVNAGTTYYYKVDAENSAGKSSKSSYASAKIATSGGGGGGTTNYEPCPPTNVKCSGSTTISISWNAATGSGCGTPTSYTVYRFDGTPNASPSWVSIASNITSKSYTDTAPHPGENKYIVTATNSEGTSANSYPATSSNIKLKAPVVKSMYGSQMGLDVTIENFIKDIPDEYLDAYYIEVFMSTTSSFSSVPTFTSKITDALNYNKYSNNLIYEYNWSVSHGSTYKYKVRLQFSASNNIVYSDYSSVYTVTH